MGSVLLAPTPDESNPRRSIAERVRELADAGSPVVLDAWRSGPGVWLKDVAAEPIDWLWPGYIALGMLTVVDGDPGLGKSTMALDLAARVSTGRPMPDGSPGVQGGVVILSAEDHLAKVIRPRLDAIDADLTRILSLEVVPAGDGGERDVEIPADLEAIEQAIVKAGAVLVIVDPLVAFLGADVNSHRDQDIRRVLRRLKALAERLRVAIVVIRHLNKAGGGNPLYRGGGSIGIIGAARGGLLVAPDPDVEGRVVMACSKSNLGQMPSSLAFYIEGASNGAGMVRWDGASTHTSATLLAATQDGGSQGSVRQDGVDFLEAFLAAGPRPTVVVEDAATDKGISPRTLDRARKEAGVIPFRVGGLGAEGQWLLRLPGSGAQSPKDAKTPTLSNLAPLGDSEYKPATTGPEVGALSGTPPPTLDGQPCPVGHGPTRNRPTQHGDRAWCDRCNTWADQAELMAAFQTLPWGEPS